MGRRKRSRRGQSALLLLAALALALGGAYVYAERAQPPTSARVIAPAAGELRVHYLDVGQGDATLWELPDGSIVVYDCGPPAASADENPVVRYLRDTLARPTGSSLLALIASHGHLDHIGGCDEVLDEYAFEHVFESWYEGTDAPESYQRFLRALSNETSGGATLHRLPALGPGATIVPGATLLWPPAFAPGGWDTIAEASLVVRLVHGETSFCFQGDIEERQEAQLAAQCDVYLVGHHGSRSASSAGWLARMEPSIAVVSFGLNGYGHPTPEALCRIEQAGATLYATHRAGPVVVASDGNDVRVLHGAPESLDSCSGESYWS